MQTSIVCSICNKDQMVITEPESGEIICSACAAVMLERIQEEGWDGKVLWLKVNESEVKGNYERDKIPDRLSYYVKDYPYYTTAH